MRLAAGSADPAGRAWRCACAAAGPGHRAAAAQEPGGAGMQRRTVVDGVAVSPGQLVDLQPVLSTQNHTQNGAVFSGELRAPVTATCMPMSLISLRVVGAIMYSWIGLHLVRA